MRDTSSTRLACCGEIGLETALPAAEARVMESCHTLYDLETMRIVKSKTV
jgi:hypothetical protein